MIYLGIVCNVAVESDKGLSLMALLNTESLFNLNSWVCGKVSTFSSVTFGRYWPVRYLNIVLVLGPA